MPVVRRPVCGDWYVARLASRDKRGGGGNGEHVRVRLLLRPVLVFRSHHGRRVPEARFAAQRDDVHCIIVVRESALPACRGVGSRAVRQCFLERSHVSPLCSDALHVLAR